MVCIIYLKVIEDGTFMMEINKVYLSNLSDFRENQFLAVNVVGMYVCIKSLKCFNVH